jgi:hypothetical protein
LLVVAVRIQRQAKGKTPCVLTAEAAGVSATGKARTSLVLDNFSR